MQRETSPVNIFWFRRDLRLDDNAGLFHALSSGLPVIPVFIFDTNILDKLPSRRDRRVNFIHGAVSSLNEKLAGSGSGLLVLHGDPLQLFPELIKEFKVNAVYCNHDYEPYAVSRDKAIGEILRTKGAGFRSFKDQVIFERKEVSKDDGDPYTVFTPYSRKWKSLLGAANIKPYAVEGFEKNYYPMKNGPVPSLEDLGFHPAGEGFLAPQIDCKLIQDYEKQRDYPAIAGTTRLSVHLRFGTVSIRKLVSEALGTSETWLNELIWREFYMMILSCFPHVADSSFKKQYDNIPWRNDEAAFRAWCEGRTGYPLVDAGMRELEKTGFMHNRVRMVTASFLVKHLLIDWRWGEAWFAEKLNDYDLAANNGGWQWAAGSGCDAAPYFRIFNPSEQLRRFDPELTYVKRWVPEYGTAGYPPPIVEHRFARERALKTYKGALQETRPREES